MKLNIELYNRIYNRSIQFCIAKYGEEPDRLEMGEDGFIAAYGYSDCGDYREREENFTIESLTEDLDKVAEERLEQQKQDEIKAEIKRKEEQKYWDKVKKEHRRNEYEKLRKEFGPKRKTKQNENP